jgi:hypothetical protein
MLVTEMPPLSEVELLDSPRWEKGSCVMRSLVAALVLVGLCGVALGEERTVVVPKDNKPFTVQQSEYVRLTGKGIGGSQIEAKVTGPAKIEATSGLREVTEGETLIGVYKKEFDLKPTGTGKVTVTITIKPPQPDAKDKVTRYVFTVE